MDTSEENIWTEAQGDKRIQKEYFGYRERFSTIVIEVPGEGREKEGKRERMEQKQYLNR